MLRNNDGYEPLISSTNNTIDLDIQPVTNKFSGIKGLMMLYVGSPKNAKKHVIEFKPGDKINPTHYKFAYNNADNSKVVLSLYNRRSFWADDVEIGKTTIPLSEFACDAADTKEVDIDNRGTKVVINAVRSENF